MGVARVQPSPSTIGDRLIAFEDGTLPEDEALDLLQDLVDTGLAWKLQGYYGRTCAALIREGVLHD